ncbi:alpha/beta fold hydrolase [Salinicoccus bachuensis]|uniref:Alpha/beta fold hydrolase n=1 Tax=Salinicoccus bachuensis TaxID=3136731 RepID=A0ABZ3CL65_9STAP
MCKIDYYKSELKDYDFRKELEKTPVKTYVYCGSHDAQCPHGFREEVADLMRNCPLATFKFNNHSLDIEKKENFKAFLELTISYA